MQPQPNIHPNPSSPCTRPGHARTSRAKARPASHTSSPVLASTLRSSWGRPVTFRGLPPGQPCRWTCCCSSSAPCPASPAQRQCSMKHQCVCAVLSGHAASEQLEPVQTSAAALDPADKAAPEPRPRCAGLAGHGAELEQQHIHHADEAASEPRPLLCCDGAELARHGDELEQQPIHHAVSQCHIVTVFSVEPAQASHPWSTAQAAWGIVQYVGSA